MKKKKKKNNNNNKNRKWLVAFYKNFDISKSTERIFEILFLFDSSDENEHIAHNFTGRFVLRREIFHDLFLKCT